MSEAIDLEEIEAAAELAARRTLSRLAASEQARAHHRELARRGDLGRNMSVPPIDRRHRAASLRDGASETDRELVRLRTASLARQAEPLAGRAPAAPGRPNAPTTERAAAIETAIETYATTVQAGRQIASEAWRVVPVVEHMRRRQQLGEYEERAAELFYRDFVLGHRVRGLVSSYGDRVNGGGQGDDGDSDEFVRTRFNQRFVAACRSIDHWPTIEWMVRIICEQIMQGETKPPTLADAGKAYLGYRNPAQQQAVGATLIKSGLERLVRHYRLDEPFGKGEGR